MTSNERWQRIEALFHEAADLLPEQRQKMLDRLRAEDPAVAGDVEALLRADAEPNVVDRPIIPQRPEADDIAEYGSHRIGQQIGPYRIVDRIAVGGMGVVYRAERVDGLFSYDVAIKLIRHDFDSRTIIRRFNAERQALAGLSHPNIARLLDGGTTGEGDPYLVMEYVDGQPIDVYCDERRLSVRDRLRLFQTICHAVHYAHQNLVVHRDIKPTNVLVTNDGQPKLLDFGIARLLDPEEPVRVDLLATERLLTPDYASPEQIQGRAITTATDVYSLGVVLYRLLTGRRPYRLTSVRLDEIERAICDQMPTPPSVTVAKTRSGRLSTENGETSTLPPIAPERLQRALKGDLDNIILTALRKEPERRYASAEQLAEDIERFLLKLPVVARRDTFAYRTSKFVARHRASVAAAVLLIVSLMAGIIGTATMAHLRGVERDIAETARASAQHEAEHARIEAESAHLLADSLIDAFLISAPSRSDEELSDIRRHLAWIERRVRRQYAGQSHLQANLLDALGRVHLSLHFIDDARSLIEEAAEIRRTQFGDDSLESALSHASLGELHHQTGDYSAATSHFSEALRIHRTAATGVHTDVALAANDLGVALRAAGRLEEAEQMHREALEHRLAQLPDDSLPVAESYDNLAHVLMAQGRFVRAEDLLRDACDIRRNVLGDDHPLTAQTENNLATVLGRQGRYDDAEILFRAAVAKLRVAPHVKPIGFAQALKNLSQLAFAKGNLGESQQLAAEAADVLERHAAPDHPLMASIRMQQARVFQKLGRIEQAESAWRRALDVKLASSPRAQSSTAVLIMSYGVFLVEQQRYDVAEPHLREALEICRQTLPSTHPTLGVACVNLGRCLMLQERYEEARPLLEEGVSLLADVHGEGSPRHRAAQDHLAALRERLD